MNRACDRCGDDDVETYWCAECGKELCERCHGDITQDWCFDCRLKIDRRDARESASEKERA